MSDSQDKTLRRVTAVRAVSSLVRPPRQRAHLCSRFATPVSKIGSGKNCQWLLSLERGSLTRPEYSHSFQVSFHKLSITKGKILKMW